MCHHRYAVLLFVYTHTSVGLLHIARSDGMGMPEPQIAGLATRYEQPALFSYQCFTSPKTKLTTVLLRGSWQGTKENDDYEKVFHDVRYYAGDAHRQCTER